MTHYSCILNVYLRLSHSAVGVYPTPVCSGHSLDGRAAAYMAWRHLQLLAVCVEVAIFGLWWVILLVVLLLLLLIAAVLLVFFLRRRRRDRGQSYPG